MNLWLDDLRPAPPGWLWVKTAQDARQAMLLLEIEHMSLDHDLGACEACLKGRTPEQWLQETNCTQMPHCEHVGTGYTFVCWMEEYNRWPRHKPTVHSANPVGAAKMRAAIERRFK